MSASPGPTKLPQPLARPLLLYEHTCRFCAWAARVVAALDRDGRLALLSMNTDEGRAWLEPLPETVRYSSWHLVLPDGSYLRKGEGALALMELLAPLRPVARLVRAFGLEPLLARAERFVSARRRRLGKIVPRVAPPRRFP